MPAAIFDIGHDYEHEAWAPQAVTALPIESRTPSDLVGGGKNVPFLLNVPLRVDARVDDVAKIWEEDEVVALSRLPLSVVASSDCCPTHMEIDETDTDGTITEEDEEMLDCCDDREQSGAGEQGHLVPAPAQCRRFVEMPHEVRLHVFRYLAETDLMVASLICRDWRALALDGTHWRVMDTRKWGHMVTDTQLTAIGTSAGGFMRVANFRGCAQLQASSLKTIASHTCNLESLTLTGCHSLTPAAIGAALDALPNLRQLNLSGLACVTEESLVTLNAPDLEDLDLTRCRNLSAAGLRRVLMEGVGDQLRTLRLTGCDRAVNNSLLEAIGQQHPLLRHLSLASCYAATDDGISALLLGCQSLERLSLAVCHRLADAGARAIGEHCPQLLQLDLSGCTEMSDAGLMALAGGCHRLEQLDLEDCSLVSDDGLRALAAGCTRLRDLSLSSCEGISDEGALAIVARCIHLKRLAVDNCPAVSNELLARLTRTTERVEVFDCRLVTEAACLQAEMQLPNLQVRSFYTWLAGVDGQQIVLDESGLHSPNNNNNNTIWTGINIGGLGQAGVTNCTIL